ncbi:MAG: hypothetical protein ACTSR3_17375 [Candidatus Helarchaeota archaeon]
MFGGLAGVFIINYPKVGIILVFISLFLADWLSDVVGVIPRQITWIPEIILIILFFKILFISGVEKKFPNTSINYSILSLILFGGISAFVNSSKLIVTFAGFRNYFKFLLLFYVIAFLELDDLFFKKMIRLLIVLAFIQVPVTIIQRYWYLGIASGDPIGGTLGSNASGTLTIFLMVIISILFSFYINRLINGKILLFSIIVLFVPMTLNETKITYFLFPALLIFLLKKSSIKHEKLKSIFTITIFSGLVLIASYNVYKSIFFKNRNINILEYRFIAKYLGNEYTKSGSLNRIAQVKFAHRNVTNQISTTLFGVGPGNASDSFFKEGVGYYYKKYETLEIGSNFLSKFIWEFGYLGLAVFLFILFKLFILADRIYKYSPNPYHKSIALGFEGIIFVLVIASVYSPSFLIDVLGYLFWFIAGYLQILWTETVKNL